MGERGRIAARLPNLTHLHQLFSAKDSSAAAGHGVGDGRGRSCAYRDPVSAGLRPQASCKFVHHELRQGITRRRPLLRSGARLARMALYGATRSEFMVLITGCDTGRVRIAALIGDSQHIDRWGGNGNAVVNPSRGKGVKRSVSCASAP